MLFHSQGGYYNSLILQALELLHGRATIYTCIQKRSFLKLEFYVLFIKLGNLPLMCLWFLTLRSGHNHPWSYRVVHTSITISFLFELFKLTWQYNRVSIQVVWSYLLSVYHYAFDSLLNKYAYYTSKTITYINVLCCDSQILLNKVFSIFAQCLFTDAPFHRINYWILTENSQQ